MRDGTPSTAYGCTAHVPRQTIFSKSPTKTRTSSFSKEFLDFYKHVSAFSLTTIAGLQCLPVLRRSLGLHVLYRSSSSIVLNVQGSTTVLRQTPGLQVLHWSPDNIDIDSRGGKVGIGLGGCERGTGSCGLPAVPTNPTGDTVSRQGPTPPTDGQVHC